MAAKGCEAVECDSADLPVHQVTVERPQEPNYAVVHNLLAYAVVHNLLAGDV